MCDLGHAERDLGHAERDLGHAERDLGHAERDLGHAERDLGHWECDLPAPVTFFGFVYTITHKPTGKMYIGKKQARNVQKRPPLQGQTKRRCIEKESDWKTYTSSSARVQQAIAKNGKDQFAFRILRFCGSKSELAYYEAKAQFDHDVLLYPDRYYNGIINLRISKVKTT